MYTYYINKKERKMLKKEEKEKIGNMIEEVLKDFTVKRNMKFVHMFPKKRYSLKELEEMKKEVFACG